MTPVYQVKGSTIRSKFDYVDQHFGPVANDALKARFEGRGLYPILTASWYSYDIYVEVLEAIAQDHFGGQSARLVEVGADSAQGALSTVYQAFVRDRGFLEFLQGISSLHHLFYNLGHIDVGIHDDGNGCEIMHRDKPRYAEADLYVASGFYQKAAELHDLSSLACEFTVGDEGADFTLTWV